MKKTVWNLLIFCKGGHEEGNVHFWVDLVEQIWNYVASPIEIFK